jgi:hypothetical protein
MTKHALQALFLAILLVVSGFNLWAGHHQSVWNSWPGFADHPWTVATLVDAYCGFLTFYVWVAWREPTTLRRVLWFVLIMGLGNITMALYVLLALRRVPAGQPVWRTLFSHAARSGSGA